MCVKGEPLHHVERNGAVGKPYFACVGVDAGWIGLESRLASEGLGDGHANHRGYVAFATGNDAFAVEQ